MFKPLLLLMEKISFGKEGGEEVVSGHRMTLVHLSLLVRLQSDTRFLLDEMSNQWVVQWVFGGWSLIELGYL